MSAPILIHDFIFANAQRIPNHPAIYFKDATLTFSQLWSQIDCFAGIICGLGLAPSERVAIYLPKQFETVIGIFCVSAAGGTFVPINPLLKPNQVKYILQNCNVRILITSGERADQLGNILDECRDLNTLILTSDAKQLPTSITSKSVMWNDLLMTNNSAKPHRRIDTDMAAILYTSGSTGQPKGVILSHRNMVAAAISSAEFLGLTMEDKLLAVLPLSFDYGLSQLTTVFSVGGSVALINYLFPRDIIHSAVKYKITGISAVPPIWNQLATLDWPKETIKTLRYITSSGGASQRATLNKLQDKLSQTRIFLMYGLTEAFRSSFLSPEEINEKPGSVGKAVPNAELMIVREDGTECAPGEPGELVHRGSLVSLGYWNDPVTTKKRFRPAPNQPQGLPNPELAVWSGDQMHKDKDGYLYFESRSDEMIKTSGYRVSPTEIEEVVFASGLVTEAVVIGIPDIELGQLIVLIVHCIDAENTVEDTIRSYCRRMLPNYMVPSHIVLRDELPRNQNGKIDRSALTLEYKENFSA